VKFSHVPRSTGGYLMTPGGARKFLAWKTIRNVAIDQDLRRTWETGIVTYGIFPRPIIPDVVMSTTDLISPRPTARTKVDNGLPSAIRRIYYNMVWLGLGNWALSLWPKHYPDPLAAQAKIGRRSQNPDAVH
jgi:hypothetical protein